MTNHTVEERALDALAAQRVAAVAAAAPKLERIVVRCIDDKVRHEGTFHTFAEALQFAAWGHACAAIHTYERTHSEKGS